VTRHRGIVVRALSWNLFHGRDAPPDPALRTWRSRLLRTTEVGETHAQVNRPLLGEFAGVLAAESWDFALLQEAPPRWLRPLGEASRASGVSALTSRNAIAPVRAVLAQANPDLMASAEGGSNQLLVRAPWRVAEVRRLTLTLWPERRRMLLARLVGPGGATLVVANLHATAGDAAAAAKEVSRAAETALEWAGGQPLLFGGDLNLRPARNPEAFERLRERFGMSAPTAPDALDHLLVRDLEVVEPARRLPAQWRECGHRAAPAGRSIRLSDHAPVVLRASMR